MPLIHHVIAGQGRPPIVFVHGFGCAHSDWSAQIAHFSPNHQTVSVDLRGHGATPGDAADCSLERYGADIAELMRALRLPPAVVVGHSMGCRVVVEAVLQAPAQAAALILVDGSRFTSAVGPVLQERFVTAEGYTATVQALFADMFTPASDPDIAAAITARAQALPRPIGEKMLTDMVRYDVTRLAASLGCLRLPVMAVQTTYIDENRERRPLRQGQDTPYLDLIRSQVPSARIEIVPEAGHFPQIDKAEQTNALIADFLAGLSPA